MRIALGSMVRHQRENVALASRADRLSSEKEIQSDAADFLTSDRAACCRDDQRTRSSGSGAHPRRFATYIKTSAPFFAPSLAGRRAGCERRDQRRRSRFRAGRRPAPGSDRGADPRGELRCGRRRLNACDCTAHRGDPARRRAGSWWGDRVRDHARHQEGWRRCWIGCRCCRTGARPICGRGWS